MSFLFPFDEPGVKQIAFYGYSQIAGGGGLVEILIDNVTVMKPTQCLPPTDLLVSNISSSSADISWTAGSDRFYRRRH